MAAKLGEYTYAQLVEILDSDEAPPAPLTRKEIREEVQRRLKHKLDKTEHSWKNVD